MRKSSIPSIRSTSISICAVEVTALPAPPPLFSPNPPSRPLCAAWFSPIPSPGPVPDLGAAPWPSFSLPEVFCSSPGDLGDTYPKPKGSTPSVDSSTLIGSAGFAAARRRGAKLSSRTPPRIGLARATRHAPRGGMPFPVRTTTGR
eukprot:scaffold13794_cov84-Phaeocystis_antarctica.AAC.1